MIGVHGTERLFVSFSRSEFMTKRHLHSGTFTLGLVATISVATALSGASCSDPSNPPSSGSSSSSSSSGTAGGGGGGEGGSSGGNVGGGGEGGFNPGATTFPAEPIFEDNLAPGIATQFNKNPGMPTGGPCVSEPPTDAMVPTNWTPVFVEWNAPVDQNVFEVKFEVDNQANALVVYTMQTRYTMPALMWKGLTINSAGHDLKITVRGAKLDAGMITAGPFTSEITTLHIAPIAAPGSVVYWAYEPVTKATSFRGFTIGDPDTKVVLTPATAGTNAGNKKTGCISCHASSPDGKIMFYSSDDVPGFYRSIDARLVTGGKPTSDMISDAAFALLGRHRQLAPILSPAHYSANDAVVITAYVVDPSINYELIWTDLHATDANGWGIIARNGDPRNPSSAAWRNDGTEIAYVSSAGGQQGVIAETTGQDPTMDIYTVPYNNRMGGDATPLPGASTTQYREFYPVYSPDDTFIAFNRTDTGKSSYDQAAAEVMLVPGKGGDATRLRANDPPACTGLKSPGLTNSWLRWAPQAAPHNGLKYYWLVFSSKRRVAAGLRPQLYVAAIVTKMEGGQEVIHAEYPAVYVASQNPLESNHTPEWDYFVVDQIPN